MAIYKYLARNHKFSIAHADTYVGASFTTISGLNSWSWEEDTNDADVSDFDNAGWNSSFAVSKGASLKLEGHYLVDELVGTRDSGQSMCEAAGHKFGPRGFRWLRVQAYDTDRVTEIGSIFVQASLKMGGGYGGGQDDVQKFAIDSTVQGRPVGSGCYNVFS